MSFSKTVSVVAALTSIFAAGATGWKLADTQKEVPLNPLDQKVMELEKKLAEVSVKEPEVVPPQPVVPQPVNLPAPIVQTVPQPVTPTPPVLPPPSVLPPVTELPIKK
jgi:hypothetical protein